MQFCLHHVLSDARINLFKFLWWSESQMAACSIDSCTGITSMQHVNGDLITKLLNHYFSPQNWEMPQ